MRHAHRRTRALGADAAAKVRAWALVVLAAVALVVYTLDQTAKIWVTENLELGVPHQVLGPLLSVQFVKNPGAAFSLASGATWIFSIVAAVVTVVIIWFAPRIRSMGWAVMFGLLLGGVLGNLTDRLFRDPGFGVGHVIDFLQIPLLPAIFNIADMGIVFSMGLFLILSIRGVALDGTRHVVSPDQPDATSVDGHEVRADQVRSEQDGAGKDHPAKEG